MPDLRDAPPIERENTDEERLRAHIRIRLQPIRDRLLADATNRIQTFIDAQIELMLTHIVTTIDPGLDTVRR
jgi:hypothetical protein